MYLIRFINDLVKPLKMAKGDASTKKPVKQRKHNLAKIIKDPKKALITLAVPIVIGMLVQVLYQITDTAFVGRLGADALAALTFLFPIFFILISLSQGIASGVNARISRYLGEKNKKAAENVAIHGIILSIAASILVITAGHFALQPMLLRLGASGSVLNLAMDFMSIILVGSIFIFPSATLSSIFAAQGDTKTSMKVQASSLVLNIILDPILIYYFGLGVKGAALATTIAYLFSMLFFLYYTEHSYLKITLKELKQFKFSMRIAKEIFWVGIPASMMMLIISIYSMFNNFFMTHFGTNYVASAGIVTRIESIVTMPMVALSIALLTLTGIFHGAKRHDLLEKTIWHAIKIGLTFALTISALVLLFPTIFIRIFTDDPAILSIAKDYLRIYALGFPLIVIAMTTSRVMQGMGRGFSSFFIHLFRLFFIAVPIAYVSIYWFNLGYLVVAGSMVFGNVLSNILSIIWVRRNVNNGNI